MTDKEAFELFDKNSDEQTRLKLRLMIHSVGVDETLKTMIESYTENGHTLNSDFIKVMRQAFVYINSNNLN